MRTQNHPFRLTATVAIAALLVPQTLPQPAMAALVLAQTLPQPVAEGAPPQDQQQSGDPPSRVGGSEVPRGSRPTRIASRIAASI